MQFPKIMGVMKMAKTTRKNTNIAANTENTTNNAGENMNNATIDKKTFSVKPANDGAAITLNNPIHGKSINELITMFGEKRVLEYINASYTIVLQRVARAALKDGQNAQNAVNEYNPNNVSRGNGNANPATAIRKMKENGLTMEQIVAMFNAV